MGRQREASRSKSGFLQRPPLPFPANRGVACGPPLGPRPPIRSGNELGVSTSIIVKLRFQRGGRREREKEGNRMMLRFLEGRGKEGMTSVLPPFCAPLALLLSFSFSLRHSFLDGWGCAQCLSAVDTVSHFCPKWINICFATDKG